MRVLVLGSKEYPMGTNVTDTLPSGGFEVYTENLVRELLGYNINILVITRKFKNTKIYEKLDNLEIYRVPWLKGFLFRTPTFNLYSFFRALTLDYEIILSNGLIASFFGFLLSKYKCCKIVMRPAGITYVQRQYKRILRHLLYQLERFTYSKADCLVLLSEQDQKAFKNKMGFLPNQTEIIPTGVDIPMTTNKNKILQEFNIDNEIIITFVGRLIKVKGIEYLIQAANMINAGNFKIIIVGGGNERESLIRLVNDMYLHEKVIFTGFRQDVADMLDATDIFVLPSLSEGLPIALLEAMASGCACVVTDIGLPIEHGKTGLVVPSANSEAIANAIRRLLANPKLRYDIGASAREYVKREHTWEKAGEKYMELFNKLKE
jgi:glycosyltransferase involved in cell wall biosynthesis